MPEPSTYRLEERRSPAGAYDFFEPQDGRLVGTTSLEVAELRQQGRSGSRRDASVGFRPFRIIGALLGVRPWHSPESRPRLVVRRPDDNEVLFTLRQASGLMYDSRRVYDGQGRLIAHFRSHFKTTVRAGFGIIDLRGLGDDCGDIQDRPWLGHVECAGDGYCVSLVSHRPAGRITPHAVDGRPSTAAQTPQECYDVEATSATQGDATYKILLLAAALTIAWRPGS